MDSNIEFDRLREFEVVDEWNEEFENQCSPKHDSDSREHSLNHKPSEGEIDEFLENIKMGITTCETSGLKGDSYSRKLELISDKNVTVNFNAPKANCFQENEHDVNMIYSSVETDVKYSRSTVTYKPGGTLVKTLFAEDTVHTSEKSRSFFTNSGRNTSSPAILRQNEDVRDDFSDFRKHDHINESSYKSTMERTTAHKESRPRGRASFDESSRRDYYSKRSEYRNEERSHSRKNSRDRKLYESRYRDRDGVVERRRMNGRSRSKENRRHRLSKSRSPPRKRNVKLSPSPTRVGRGENHYQDNTKTSAVPSNISHPIHMRNIDVYKPPQPNYPVGIPTHPQPPHMVEQAVSFPNMVSYPINTVSQGTVPNYNSMAQQQPAPVPDYNMYSHYQGYTPQPPIYPGYNYTSTDINIINPSYSGHWVNPVYPEPVPVPPAQVKLNSNLDDCQTKQKEHSLNNTEFLHQNKTKNEEHRGHIYSKFEAEKNHLKKLQRKSRSHSKERYEPKDMSIRRKQSPSYNESKAIKKHNLIIDTCRVPTPPPPPILSNYDINEERKSKVNSEDNVSLSCLLEAAMKSSGQGKSQVIDSKMKENILSRCESKIQLLYKRRMAGLGVFMPDPVEDKQTDCNSSPLIANHPSLSFNSLADTGVWRCQTIKVPPVKKKIDPPKCVKDTQQVPSVIDTIDQSRSSQRNYKQQLTPTTHAHLNKNIQQSEPQTTPITYPHLNKSIQQSELQSTPITYPHLNRNIQQSELQSTPITYAHLNNNIQNSELQNTPITYPHLNRSIQQSELQSTPITYPHLNKNIQQSELQTTPITYPHLNNNIQHSELQNTPITYPHLNRNIQHDALRNTPITYPHLNRNNQSIESIQPATSSPSLFVAKNVTYPIPIYPSWPGNFNVQSTSEQQKPQNNSLAYPTGYGTQSFPQEMNNVSYPLKNVTYPLGIKTMGFTQTGISNTSVQKVHHYGYSSKFSDDEHEDSRKVFDLTGDKKARKRRKRKEDSTASKEDVNTSSSLSRRKSPLPSRRKKRRARSTSSSPQKINDSSLYKLPKAESSYGTITNIKYEKKSLPAKDLKEGPSAIATQYKIPGDGNTDHNKSKQGKKFGSSINYNESSDKSLDDLRTPHGMSVICQNRDDKFSRSSDAEDVCSENKECINDIDIKDDEFPFVEVPGKISFNDLCTIGPEIKQIQQKSMLYNGIILSLEKDDPAYKRLYTFKSTILCKIDKREKKLKIAIPRDSIKELISVVHKYFHSIHKADVHKCISSFIYPPYSSTHIYRIVNKAFFECDQCKQTSESPDRDPLFNQKSGKKGEDKPKTKQEGNSIYRSDKTSHKNLEEKKRDSSYKISSTQKYPDINKQKDRRLEGKPPANEKATNKIPSSELNNQDMPCKTINPTLLNVNNVTPSIVENKTEELKTHTISNGIVPSSTNNVENTCERKEQQLETNQNNSLEKGICSEGILGQEQNPTETASKNILVIKEVTNPETPLIINKTDIVEKVNRVANPSKNKPNESPLDFKSRVREVQMKCTETKDLIKAIESGDKSKIKDETYLMKGTMLCQKIGKGSSAEIKIVAPTAEVEAIIAIVHTMSPAHTPSTKSAAFLMKHFTNIEQLNEKVNIFVNDCVQCKN